MYTLWKSPKAIFLEVLNTPPTLSGIPSEEADLCRIFDPNLHKWLKDIRTTRTRILDSSIDKEYGNTQLLCIHPLHITMKSVILTKQRVFL